jgi:hypothetical protein
MNSRKRAKIVLVLFALVVAVGIITWSIPRIFRGDFRKSLAKQLNVDPDFLHLNIPPAPNRLPGAAFVVRGPALLLVPPLARDQLGQGATFEMDWRELDRSDAQSHLNAGPWSGLFSAETSDTVRLRLRDCRILEAAPEPIRKQLVESADVRRQANAGHQPLVIVRSYEGRLELKIERGNKSNAAVWANKLKVARETGAVTSADGKLKVAEADDQHVVISWMEPVVFAYEAASARLFADHLGSTPDRIELTPVREATATIARAGSVRSDPTTPNAPSKKND